MISLGYVGVNTVLPSASKTFRIRNYTEERMLEYARLNLGSLGHILQWNLGHKIFIFRITSHLIPYGSSPVNPGAWKDVLKNDFERLGRFIKQNNITVSMHPGQYSVLNTPNEGYFQNTLSDLNYHSTIMELMQLDSSHRIVIHGGGIYKDKVLSTKLLKERIGDLPLNIRSRLTLENDERAFNAKDILKICKKLKLPATLDVFHHQVLPSFKDLKIKEVLIKFNETWQDERQAIHYSNQNPKKRRGAHSQSVDLAQFSQFYNQVKDLELDIMLEVKDKQESVLKLRKAFPEIK